MQQHTKSSSKEVMTPLQTALMQHIYGEVKENVKNFKKLLTLTLLWHRINAMQAFEQNYAKRI